MRRAAYQAVLWCGRRGNGAAGGGRRHDRVPYGPSAPEAGAIKNQPRRHSASGVERCCKRLAELCRPQAAKQV